MADRLTQLQDCYDDLLSQMFAAIHYIHTRHSYAQVEGQPDLNPHSANPHNASATNGAANGDGHGQNGNNDSSASPDDDVPDAPQVFRSNMNELARDLVIKEQQIEYLISVLPGIGNSQAEQDARIQALEAELREVDQARKAAIQDREQMLHLLGDLAAKCKRVY